MSLSSESSASWKLIQEGLEKSFNYINDKTNKFTPQEFCSLHSAVYAFCTDELSPSDTDSCIFGEPLYDLFQQFARSTCADYVKQLSELMDELGILKEYGRLWRVYFEGAKKVHRFADYLNRYWIQRELENEAIHIHYLLQTFLSIWYEEVLVKLGPSLFDTLYSSLDLLRTAKLNEVRYTGKDEQITQFSNDCIRLFFESVQILGENLPFIPDLMLDFYLHSSKFYNGYFTLFLEENASLEEYLLLVTAIYAFEGRCLEKVYIGLSKDKFEEMLHEAIVKPHVPLLIGEFPRLLGNTNRLLGEPSDGSLAIADDFGGVCFKLLAKEGEKSIENMRRHYEEFVIQSTTLFLQRASEKYPRQECPHGGESCSSVLFIEHVLKEFKELKIKCEKHFEVFLSSLSKGFKVGLGRWSPFIGIFCDSLDALLTGASRDFDGAELDIFVENSGLLLRHIEDKESVMNIYGEKLSARLLHNKSTSITTEVALVEQWRRQCGPDFTQKLEKMIQDMEVSREEMSYFLANYHGSTATNDISWDSACNIPGRGFPFNVFLCSAGSWPFESHLALGVQKNFQWPLRLSKFICAFENTYQERHSGRLLTFLPFESYGELFFYPNSTNVARESGSRSATKYTLACSAPQMAILLLLGKQSYVVNELQNILGISLDLFWYFLEPLLEHNIVLKEILRKDVENSIMHEDLSETLLVANTEFYSDNHLIVLTSNSSSKTSALLSKAALSQRDPSHRIFAIQAALIRLLKEHKELAIDSIFDLLTEKMNLYITPEQRDTLPLVYTALEEKGFLIIEKDKLKYLP